MWKQSISELQYRHLLKVLILAASSFASAVVSANPSRYDCEEHPYFLVIESEGFDHVNHRALINGQTLIKELRDAMWFIEIVICTKQGFRIVAGHIQYNDPTKKQFKLTVTSESEYEIR